MRIRRLRCADKDYGQRDVAPAPVVAERMAIGPEFFRVLGLVPWQGREFSPDDEAHGLPVAIVNRSLADWLWPGLPSVIGQVSVVHEEHRD